MGDRRDEPKIVEQFTFRSHDRAVTVDAIIDTGATNTAITDPIVEALGLEVLNTINVGLAGGSAATASLYSCVVAWTIYERQGYHSRHDVLCIPGSSEVLIGFDFLSRHKLTVDTHHRGLVGTAPSSAVPLTGGGYALNVPHQFILELNRARADAASPGDVLRPHPAWRFKLPAIVKGQRADVT